MRDILFHSFFYLYECYKGYIISFFIITSQFFDFLLLLFVIQFFEVLKIFTSNTTVEVRLFGEGVEPRLALEPSDRYLDIGDALVLDSMYQTLKVI